MSIKKIIYILNTLLLVFCLNACGVKSIKKTSSIQYNNKKIIKVGVYESFTGESAVAGIPELYGIRYANEKYNTVEIAGEKYKIELVELDNKSDENTVEETAKKIINEKIAFVIGGFGANISLKASDVFEKAGVPFLVPGEGHPNINNGKDFCYKLIPDDTFISTAMANFIKNDGANNVVVVSEEKNQYNESIIKYFEKACKALEIDILDNVHIEIGDNNFDSMFDSIKEKKPEYIFVPCSISKSPYIIKSIRNVGINCNILASDIWDYKDVINIANDACEGLNFVSYFDSKNLETSAAQKFIYGEGSDKGFFNYLIANSQDGDITSIQALGYDAYMAIYYAMKNATSTKMEDVKESLDNVNFEGVTGTISFDEYGDLIQKRIIIKNIKNSEPIYKETVRID